MLFDRPISIPMEDPTIHTDHDLFCSDRSCPCHEEDDSVVLQVQDGFLTPEEATRAVLGRQL